MQDAAEAPAVIATATALDAIADIVRERGPVMFFQSGGCCDGSLPICLDQGELLIGAHDVMLGRVGGCSFFIDGRQHEVWKHTQLILDVGEGAPEGFSLPAADDRHFIIRSRLFPPPPDQPEPAANDKEDAWRCGT